MVTRALKQPDAPLRYLLKMLKTHWDDGSTIRRYLPSLQWQLSTDFDPENAGWKPEALHWRGKIYEDEGELEKAKQCYLDSLACCPDFKVLCRARTLRELGTFEAVASDDVPSAIEYLELALALHDEDLRSVPRPRGKRLLGTDDVEKWKAKGARQRRITLSHLLHARLIGDRSDDEARSALVTLALSECRDCSLRDQHQIVGFALEFADAIQKPLVEARHAELCARSHDLPGLVVSITKTVIDAELYLLTRFVRFMI